MSIVVCLAAFVALILLLRYDRASFGIPVAYLALLLLNHVPGAYAHLMADGALGTDEFTRIGIGYTAVASLCLVLGVALGRVGPPRAAAEAYADRRRFTALCLVGGWILVWGLTPLRSVPSLGAAIEKGAAIWVLGVVLGLRYAVWAGSWRRAALWTLALVVYPVMMLVLGGFLSYGTTAILAAISVLAVSTRSNWRVFAGVALAVFASMTLFVNYYANRDEMRATVWSNAGIAQRIDANLGMFRNFQLFDGGNPKHLKSLDDRLNQNIFIGIAQTRLQGGQVDYLHGRSVSDAVLSLVPRALWPDKPVYGGSPAIVSKMTGLQLNQNTSFGVGQVMEFQINFGLIGVILGFVLLGWLLGLLDLKAALAERRGDLGGAILFFLPAVALLQPIGSLIELSGGAAAALVAAVGWRFAWRSLEEARTRTVAQGRAARPAQRKA